MGILGIIKVIEWRRAVHAVVIISQAVSTTHNNVKRAVHLYQSPPRAKLKTDLTAAWAVAKAAIIQLRQALRQFIEELWRSWNLVVAAVRNFYQSDEAQQFHLEPYTSST